jgi:hypothetical protein
MTMSDDTMFDRKRRLGSIEVASRLGISGEEVYRLIFAGELDGRPDADGIVHVSEASVEQYQQSHAT